jgi:hypothetical protein
MWRGRSLLVGCVLLPAWACQSDECELGPPRCDGNVAENCVSVSDTELTSHTELERTDCGLGVCQTPPLGTQAGAFCALEAARDPALSDAQAEMQHFTACADGAAVAWSFGFRITVESCTIDQPCVDASTAGFDPSCSNTAFCATSNEPDVRCTPGIGSACATETDIFYCACGFARDVHPCASPGPSCVLEEASEDLPPQGVCR